MKRIDIQVGGTISFDLEFDPDFVFEPSRVGRLFAEELVRSDLRGKKVLDVGSGSGILAITAALCGARVTASDINPEAVEASLRNAERAGVSITGLVSDGLLGVPDRDFDLIVANCPLMPATMSSRANTPVENGPAGRRLLDSIIQNSSSYLVSEGSLLTWCADMVDIAAAEDLMMTHWQCFERIRDIEICYQSNRGRAYFPGADLNPLVENGRMRRVGNNYFSHARMYRLYPFQSLTDG